MCYSLWQRLGESQICVVKRTLTFLNGPQIKIGLFPLILMITLRPTYLCCFAAQWNDRRETQK